MKKASKAAPERRSQAERRRVAREKLVQGAIQLLKTKRYAGFRTAELSALTGLSAGTRSHYFATKDDLVLLALEQVYRETSERSLKRIRAATPTREGMIKALVQDSGEFFLGDDFLLSLDLVMVGGDTTLGAAVRKLAQQYRYAVEDAWRSALSKVGYRASEADELVWMTFALGRGLGIRQVMSGPSARFKKVLRNWAEVAPHLPLDSNHSGASTPRYRATRTGTSGI